MNTIVSLLLADAASATAATEPGSLTTTRIVVTSLLVGVTALYAWRVKSRHTSGNSGH